jgi:RNA 3'-terminal phosphate cyclase (ATP)
MVEAAIQIDGSQGEGGGQMVRSSLALSLVTQRPVVIANIREGRSKPGLMRQHLVAVRAAAEIGKAKVAGDVLRGRQLSFEPKGIAGGDYAWQIGSAGSATLVLQTILPALLHASEPTRLTIGGGTHNPWAPCFDFIDNCYLPLLRRMGADVQGELMRAGFFPAGGGEICCSIQPTGDLTSISVDQRGELQNGWCEARVANLPWAIAEREAKKILHLSRWRKESCRARQVEATGPGNVVLIGLEFEHLTEMFTGFGRQGVPAEHVAHDAWKEAAAFLDTNAAIGPYLADQFMLPLALAAHAGSAGQFTTTRLTRHSTTHLELIQRFLAVDASVESLGQVVQVKIWPR